MTKTVKITFSKTSKSKSDTLAACVGADGAFSPEAEALNKQSGGTIRQWMDAQDHFTGKAGQVAVIAAPKNKDGVVRYMLVGMGEVADLTAAEAAVIGGKFYSALKSTGAEQVTFFAAAKGAAKADKKSKKSDEKQSLGADAIAAHIAEGVRLRAYDFDLYKSTEKGSSKKGDKKARTLQSVDIVLDEATKAAAFDRDLAAAAAGTHVARDLTNEPPNVIYPDSYAKRIAKMLQPLGIHVEILDEKKMAKLGMESHLAVGQGSARPPRVVIMRYAGKSGGKATKSAKTAPKMTKPLAFVGKGVTFDTGGISIKPAAGMDDMKMDMGGSAAVVGLMHALASRKAKVDVVGIVGLAENMPSDRAYRPGDIINSMAGKTIEVLNTDAEGRLVLCDALTYVQKHDKPKMIIDLATLTGAIMVALGPEYAGAYANDETLWTHLNDASQKTGEKLWRMPLDDFYRKSMVSTIADLKNISGSPHGGSCTAAGFLQHFIEGDTPWAHLDIAGTAWVNADKPLGPKGATGFGVRVLNQMVMDYYE